ncbi:MAG: hypothetical protein ACTMIR_08855, partial [Cellulomonadaceae bacterium]
MVALPSTAAAVGIATADAQDLYRMSRQDEARGEVCSPVVLAALTTATSVGAAIGAVKAARPDWSTSRCTRLVRATWDRRDELAERSRTYVL